VLRPRERTVEIWIEQNNGLLRGPDGEMISIDEFELPGMASSRPDCANSLLYVGTGDMRRALSSDRFRGTEKPRKLALTHGEYHAQVLGYDDHCASPIPTAALKCRSGASLGRRLE
jgi:hypothetical protein